MNRDPERSPADTQPESREIGSLWSAMLFCLALLLLGSVLLVTNTLPSVKRNRALRDEVRELVDEKARLQEELGETKLLYKTLLTDPVAVQREALLQRGFTPHQRDVLVR